MRTAVTLLGLLGLLEQAGCDDPPRLRRVDDGEHGEARPWWASSLRPPSRAERGLAQLRRLRDEACACSDSSCAEAVSNRLTELAERYTDFESSGASQAEAQEIVEGMASCLTEAYALQVDRYDLDDVVPPPDIDAGSGSIAECDAYLRVVEQYLDCDTIPQAARDAVRQSLQYMRDGWRDSVLLGDDTRRQIADACTQGADAIRTGATAMGCWISPDQSP